MGSFDAFGLFWSGIVLLMMVVGVLWGINDLKTGSARLNLMGFGDRVRREEEPFEFWLVVGSKFMILPVGAFMLRFASDMIWR